MEWICKGTSLKVNEELKAWSGHGEYITSNCGMYCVSLRDDGCLVGTTGKTPRDVKNCLFYLKIERPGNYAARLLNTGVIAIYQTDGNGHDVQLLWISENNQHQFSNDYAARILDNGDFGIATDASQKENNRWSMAHIIPTAINPATSIKVSNLKFDIDGITLVDKNNKIIEEPEEKILDTCGPIPNPPRRDPTTLIPPLKGVDISGSYWGELPFGYGTGVEASNVKIPVIFDFDSKTKKPEVELIDSDVIFFGWNRTQIVNYNCNHPVDIPAGKAYQYTLSISHAIFHVPYTFDAKVTFTSGAIIDISLKGVYQGENGWNVTRTWKEIPLNKIIEAIPLAK